MSYYSLYCLRVIINLPMYISTMCKKGITKQYRRYHIKFETKEKSQIPRNISSPPVSAQNSNFESDQG